MSFMSELHRESLDAMSRLTPLARGAIRRRTVEDMIAHWRDMGPSMLIAFGMDPTRYSDDGAYGYLPTQIGARRDISSQKLHNASQYACRIPAEVIQHIFEDCISASDPASDAVRPWHWFRLSHVCSLWRTIALDTPVLWYTIDLSAGERWTEESACRSYDRPLIIGWYTPGPVKLSYVHLLYVRHLLPRCKSVRLHNATVGYATHYQKHAHGKKQATPLLEELHITMPRDQDDCLFYRFLEGPAPRLRRLTLHNFAWDTWEYEEPFENVTQLSLGGSSISHSLAIYDINIAPNVEDLEIVSFDIEQPFTDDTEEEVSSEGGSQQEDAAVELDGVEGTGDEDGRDQDGVDEEDEDEDLDEQTMDETPDSDDGDDTEFADLPHLSRLALDGELLSTTGLFRRIRYPASAATKLSLHCIKDKARPPAVADISAVFRALSTHRGGIQAPLSHLLVLDDPYNDSVRIAAWRDEQANGAADRPLADLQLDFSGITLYNADASFVVHQMLSGASPIALGAVQRLDLDGPRAWPKQRLRRFFSAVRDVRTLRVSGKLAIRVCDVLGQCAEASCLPHLASLTISVDKVGAPDVRAKDGVGHALAACLKKRREGGLAIRDVQFIAGELAETRKEELEILLPDVITGTKL